MSTTIKQGSAKEDFCRDSFVSIREDDGIESQSILETTNLDASYEVSHEKFEDLPLLLTNSDKQKVFIKPHLVVEDKGEKRD